MKTRLFALVMALMVIGGACASTARAAMVLGDDIPLSQLIDGGQLIVGDKLFEGFTYSFTEDMPSADAVNVIPIADEEGNFGIRFQAGFLDLPGGSPSDALIEYIVTVLDPLMRITDAHLAGNPALLAGTGTLAAVTETFLPDAPEAVLSIFDNGDVFKLTDSVIFDEAHVTIHVQKDILLNANGDVAATLSFVDQTFSQTAIPEPATMSLLGLAAAGMLARRRRR